jgi:hypothetical protein
MVGVPPRGDYRRQARLEAGLREVAPGRLGAPAAEIEIRTEDHGLVLQTIE